MDTEFQLAENAARIKKIAVWLRGFGWFLLFSAVLAIVGLVYWSIIVFSSPETLLGTNNPTDIQWFQVLSIGDRVSGLLATIFYVLLAMGFSLGLIYLLVLAERIQTSRKHRR
jgi:allophanate hydrolase subunit 1